MVVGTYLNLVVLLWMGSTYYDIHFVIEYTPPLALAQQADSESKIPLPYEKLLFTKLSHQGCIGRGHSKQR